MNSPTTTHEPAPTGNEREEMLAALFANMIIQQANVAMMMLGKVPHPETGQIVQDLEAARMFIDQLEMIQAKTKGNLSPREDGLLRQALSAVQMAFVEAIDGTPGATEATTPHLESAPDADAAPAQPPIAPPTATAAQPSPDESRKKFSKKY